MQPTPTIDPDLPSEFAIGDVGGFRPLVYRRPFDSTASQDFSAGTVPGPLITVPPFGPYGGVILDGVQFSTDPEPYEPLNWKKRHSVHTAIGGLVTVQDFGVFMKDNTLKLGSGNERFLEESVMLALHSRYRNRGTIFTLTDWRNNSFQVFIKDFIAVPYKQGLGASGGVVSLWRYSLELQVISITSLVGNTFTGP